MDRADSSLMTRDHYAYISGRTSLPVSRNSTNTNQDITMTLRQVQLNKTPVFHDQSYLQALSRQYILEISYIIPLI